MTAEQLKAWQARHGYTYDTAAQALGMSRATYARYLASAEQLPRWLALACAAVDLGVDIDNPLAAHGVVSLAGQPADGMAAITVRGSAMAG